MTPLGKIRDLLELPALTPYAADPRSWFTARDEIKRLIAERLATKPTADWLAVLEPADIWCAKVLEWPELMESDGFKALDMLQTVTRDDGVSITTTRSPLRIDGQRTMTTRAAPLIGEQSAAIRKEFDL
jgi:crotonobetainyl-CoA:carnitine CoA-transferase CaiB-like acyl-CoA transferase